MINEGFIPTDIASRLDISKQLVSYYIKKAIESGYVRELLRDTFKAYEFTQPGKNFLAMSYHQHSSSSMSKPICRAENIRFKAHVYKMPSPPVDWHKVEMHNWTQHTTEVDCIKIRLNAGETPTIEFIPAPIDGDDPYAIYGKLLLGCSDVARKLEKTLGMKIGLLERSCKGEWVVYNPLAKVITNKIGQITLEGIGKINASLPNIIDNSTYNILITLGKEADFLYSTLDTYIEDAKKDNRQPLVEIWNRMKRDKEKHLQMLREALEKEAKDEKLSK
jgi:hypothetical protein